MQTTPPTTPSPRARWVTPLAFAVAAIVLAIVYALTLQTIINGSEDPAMIDVGETQVVLNIWGTLHATGYPHYVMSGAAIVGVLRAVGVDPATAPAIVSLVWGAIALALIAALMLNVLRSADDQTGGSQPRPYGRGLSAAARALIAATVVTAFGVTRVVWLHQVIAEIYTFGLMLLTLLLWIALREPPVRRRLYWLALVGGIAVAHHRALALAIPALLMAVWPDLVGERRAIPRKLLLCLGLGLIGWAFYLYLPLREAVGARWVYGEPGTLSGLWDQIIGREASRFIGSVNSVNLLIDNLGMVTRVLVDSVHIGGAIGGVIGLLIGIVWHPTRRAAIVITVSGAAAYGFHVVAYTDILAALILAAALSLAFGWWFGLAWLASLLTHGLPVRTAVALMRAPVTGRIGEMGTRYLPSFVNLLLSGNRRLWPITVLPALVLIVGLISTHAVPIRQLTTDAAGLETIRLVSRTPPGATLMLAWGARHFAAGYARDVMGILPDVELVDHKADFRAIAAARPLITPEYTLYAQPIAWWQDQLSAAVYLSAAAPGLVRIATAPQLLEPLAALTMPAADGDPSVSPITASIDCATPALHVTWYAPANPPIDASVYVQGLDALGLIRAQGDQRAPVYGWRPLTTWAAGEVVADSYPIAPSLDGVETIRYGLYLTREDGTLENLSEYTVAVHCEDER